MDLDDEGDFVDMVEGNLEEDMELVQEEDIRRRANAQEQVRGGDRERRKSGRLNCITSIVPQARRGEEEGRQVERRGVEGGRMDGRSSFGDIIWCTTSS